MKNIFLFAAAAMVSLSSCVQTEDVYTGGLNEIGFKSAVSRAVVEGTTFTGSMTVAAAWDAEGDGTFVQYFAPTEFVDASGIWSGNPSRYWPNAGIMDFIAHYPHSGSFAAPITGDKLVGYTVTGIQNKEKQDDVLYSDVLRCKCPQSATQALKFHHAMTLLQVNFATTLTNTNDVVIIKSATVNDVVFDGDLAVTGEAGTGSKAVWSNHGAATNYTFAGIATDYDLEGTVNPEKASTPLLILPSKTGEKQTQMTIVYWQNDHELTKVVPLKSYGAWEMGKKYIYNFTITANEIQFTVSVDDWNDSLVNNGVTI